jgi:hypothetical protein
MQPLGLHPEVPTDTGQCNEGVPPKPGHATDKTSTQKTRPMLPELWLHIWTCTPEFPAVVDVSSRWRGKRSGRRTLGPLQTPHPRPGSFSLALPARPGLGLARIRPQSGWGQAQADRVPARPNRCSIRPALGQVRGTERPGPGPLIGWPEPGTAQNSMGPNKYPERLRHEMSMYAQKVYLRKPRLKTSCMQVLTLLPPLFTFLHNATFNVTFPTANKVSIGQPCQFRMWGTNNSQNQGSEHHGCIALF